VHPTFIFTVAIPFSLIFQYLFAMGNFFSTPGDISNKDIIVIVIGQPGAGKSSFINTAAGSKLPVGHSLKSCTKVVQSVPAISKAGRKVIFVDTPAFDIDLDNNAETNLKKKIEKWQKKTSTQKNIVAGILYLHKISEPRMTEPPLRRLKTFEKLCGGSLPEKVILVTTMWDGVNSAEGSSREEQLRAKYWKATTNRPNMVRFEDTTASDQAWHAVDLLLERSDAMSR